MRGFYAVTVAAIFVVFSQQTAHSHHHSKELPTCPEDEHGEIILYPKPENCSEFYQCAGGHLYTHHCGPDLYYCAAKEYCDYLYNCDYSNCQMPDAKAKADLPVCEPPSGEPTDVTYYPNAENCSNYYECDNGFLHNLDCPADLQFCSEKSACTWSWDKECAFADCVVQSAKFDTYEVNLEEELPKCPIPTDGNVTLLPNPANCSSFYECDNMVPILTSCPPDLYFCSEQDTCSWLWDTACSHSDCKILGKNVDEAEEHSLGIADLPVCAPPGQSPDATYYPNPDNCSLYYECSNGNLLSLSCSGDLLYCSEKEVCSWDWDKECAFSDCVKTLSEVVDVKGPADITCPPIGEGEVILYPNPDNCSTFYECDNMGPVLLQCPGDLLYCSELKNCAWSWDKNCSFSDCKITTNPAAKIEIQPAVTCPVPEDGNVTFVNNPNNCSAYYECDNMVPIPMECPEQTYFCTEKSTCSWIWDPECAFTDCKIVGRIEKKVKADVVCPVPEDGNVTFVNNPNNCSAYYECDNMVPIPMECPEQTYFCTEKSTCSWIWDSECAFTDCKILGRKPVNDDQETFGVPICPPPSGNHNVSYFPNSENCSNYYECDNGRLHILDCPAGLVFCSEKNACTWSWDKECAFDDCTVTTESHASAHRIKLPHKKPHKLSIKHQKHNI